MEDEEWMSVFSMRTEDLQDQWTLQMDDSIQPEKPQHGFFKYLKGSFAQFRCSRCGRSWPSKRVMVAFHFSLDVASGHGTVKVRRFRQDCRRCNDRKKEKPKFGRENIDVMVEKLIEKIKYRCYGQDVGKSGRTPHFNGRVNGPHESAHCEACQEGICQKST